jgi:regulator of sirC expression with transglutaminase-like and TPR domain
LSLSFGKNGQLKKAQKKKQVPFGNWLQKVQWNTQLSISIDGESQFASIESVRKEGISAERERALIQLLEDTSPVVREALEAEFRRLGPDGMGVLKRASRSGDAATRSHADELLKRVLGPDPSNKLVHFIRGLSWELETGLILINQVLYPDLKIEEVRAQLDMLAARCKELAVTPLRAREQCLVLNRVLFHESAFRGSSEEREDPLGSCIEAVLRRRSGHPLILAAIYILVAQRLGLDLEPIFVPGHHLVGCFHDDDPLYINPFERGRFRDVKDLQLLLKKQHILPQFHHLVPVPVGEVLRTVCRDLARQFEARNEHKWANRFRTFLREFEETYRRRSEA